MRAVLNEVYIRYNDVTRDGLLEECTIRHITRAKSNPRANLVLVDSV